MHDPFPWCRRHGAKQVQYHGDVQVASVRRGDRRACGAVRYATLRPQRRRVLPAQAREKPGRQEAGRNAVRYLVSRFFRNSPELLVLNLLEDEELSEPELRRIRQLLGEESQ